jgi:hypothetical protein
MKAQHALPLCMALLAILASCDKDNPCGSPPGCSVLRVAPDGSGDYPTIQAAIAAAESLDVIELANGIYGGMGNRDLDLLGKAITLRSRSGNPDSCVIDCAGTAKAEHRGIQCISGEGALTLVLGLTIAHGRADGGGAARCTSSSPTFRRCVFHDNLAYYVGGAVDCQNSSALFDSCEFFANASHMVAGAVAVTQCSGLILHACSFETNGRYSGTCFLYESSALIDRCTFWDNTGTVVSAQACDTVTIRECTFAGNVGPILSAWSSTACALHRCTLAYNDAGDAPLIEFRLGARLDASNTVIALNTTRAAVSDSSDASLSCSDVFGNSAGDWVGSIADQLGSAGNICADPLFREALGRDYSLLPGSPCSADSSACGQIGAWGSNGRGDG